MDFSVSSEASPNVSPANYLVFGQRECIFSFETSWRSRMILDTDATNTTMLRDRNQGSVKSLEKDNFFQASVDSSYINP